MLHILLPISRDCSAESEYGYVYDVYYSQGSDGETLDSKVRVLSAGYLTTQYQSFF